VRSGGRALRGAGSDARQATHPATEGLLMKINKNPGLLLLGIYLFLHGINGLFKLDIPVFNTVLTLLVLLSGLVILLFDRPSS
jgi:hypothetical protein